MLTGFIVTLGVFALLSLVAAMFFSAKAHQALESKKSIQDHAAQLQRSMAMPRRRALRAEIPVAFQNVNAELLRAFGERECADDSDEDTTLVWTRD